MRRLATVGWVLGGVALAIGLQACHGHLLPGETACGDCNCPDSFTLGVTSADRAEVVGGSVVVGFEGIDVVYDVSGSTFQASYAYDAADTSP